MTDRLSLDAALSSFWAHGAYVLFVIAVVLLIPPGAFTASGHDAIVIVGVVGAWRYGWGLLHFVRSIYFRRVAYPKMRAEAERAAAAGVPPRAFLLVTSFRIDTETTRRVYTAAIRAAFQAPGPAVIVASIVEMADQRIIKEIFDAQNTRDDIQLVFVRISGTGKRDALAYGFRAIAKMHPEDDDVVAVIDGDSIVPSDLIARCAPLFALSPRVGALTTDEYSEVTGDLVFREWYALRFAQRHILMCSMGLAKRVLTLTGRMSMFRAGIVKKPDFIARVELDYLDHWRLGRFKFLTGDDKSSWFDLLSRGDYMLYVPDVRILTIESPPTPHFVESAVMLMRRWFGNMLRTNGRAIALGPQRIGFFTWWSIVDQRISMWTCLTGIVFAVLGALFISPYTLLFYVVWVLMSRYVYSLSLYSATDRVSVLFPILLYFNQIVGSWVKIYVFFRPDKQKWTRQNTVAARNLASWRARANMLSSAYLNTLAVIAFIAAIGWLMGVFPVPQSIMGMPIKPGGYL
jgi:mannuronan synthase